MQFNQRPELKDQHAFLSPSSYHWINYSDEKLIDRLSTRLASLRGTALHEFANHAIRMKQKLQSTKRTLNLFVNDAIGFRMESEQLLYYSENCFGTADAISFRRNVLRVHDLKTGVTPASMIQLRLYAALFCLEYEIDPLTIEIELRIYQNDEVIIEEADKSEIKRLMFIIVERDRVIKKHKEENFS